MTRWRTTISLLHRADDIFHPHGMPETRAIAFVSNNLGSEPLFPFIWDFYSAISSRSASRSRRRSAKKSSAFRQHLVGVDICIYWRVCSMHTMWQKIYDESLSVFTHRRLGGPWRLRLPSLLRCMTSLGGPELCASPRRGRLCSSWDRSRMFRTDNAY